MPHRKQDAQNVTSLSLKKFTQLVTTYGANPARWPADRRQSGEAFLQHSAEAKAIAGRETMLDHLLEDARPINRAALHDKIIAQIPAANQMPNAGLFGDMRTYRHMIAGATLMAACLLAGVFSVPYLPVSQLPLIDLANISGEYAMLDFNLWNMGH